MYIAICVFFVKGEKPGIFKISGFLVIMEDKEMDVGKYVDLTALLLDLQLWDEYRDGVVANFERIKDIALVVNEFPLPDNIEAAPVFEP